jgi:hypothetical protein
MRRVKPSKGAVKPKAGATKAKDNEEAKKPDKIS